MKKTAKVHQIVAILLVAATTFVANLSVAQTKTAGSTKPEVTSQNAAQQDKSRGGPQEGIKLHGHWTIVIKNPDGSVASRNEFENALYPGGGDYILAALLSRSASIGFWGVVLDGPTGARPCVLSGAQAACEISETNGPQLTGPQIFTNLSIQRTGDLHGVVLSGSATSANGGQIASVESHLLYCDPSVVPSACWGFGASSREITSHTLTAPIAVQAGQIMQVTVTITFS